jgi:hypothetical protein
MAPILVKEHLRDGIRGQGEVYQVDQHDRFTPEGGVGRDTRTLVARYHRRVVTHY